MVTPDLVIIGVDASPRMLKRARSKFIGQANVSFVHAHAEHLPLADDSFDWVVSASTLHYFRDPVICLREMRRVLHPQGRLRMIDWSRNDPIMRLRDSVLRLVDPAHVRTYARDEVSVMLDKAGFTLHRIESFRCGSYALFFVEAGGSGS